MYRWKKQKKQVWKKQEQRHTTQDYLRRQSLRDLGRMQQRMTGKQ